MCPDAIKADSNENSDNNSSGDNSNADKRFHLLYNGTTITYGSTGLMWQNYSLDHDDREATISDCANLLFEGYNDWRLSTTAKDKKGSQILRR